MNKLFPIVLALLCFGFLLSMDQVTENHPNGMPKVIKTYKGSNKLELTKEIGYYSNGVKKYQTTYHKGKIKDTQRWDENGIKQKDYYKFNGHQTLTRKADCEDAMGVWSKIYYLDKFYYWDGTEENCSSAGGIYTAPVTQYGVEGDAEYSPPVEADCYIESTSDEETCLEPESIAVEIRSPKCKPKKANKSAKRSCDFPAMGALNISELALKRRTILLSLL